MFQINDYNKKSYQVCDACRYDDYLLDEAPSLHGDYDDVHTDHGWEVDSFFRPPRVPQQGYVWLDPHILANPAIADIDGDGQEELVLAVSYFFDRDQYSRPVSSALTACMPAPSRVLWRECMHVQWGCCWSALVIALLHFLLACRARVLLPATAQQQLWLHPLTFWEGTQYVVIQHASFIQRHFMHT